MQNQVNIEQGDMRNSAGYSNPTTSKMAAKAIQPKLARMRLKVYKCIEAAGAIGIAGEQICDQTGLLLSTSRPRCTELREIGRASCRERV